jgi:phosphatidylethanolamine-binding protein (PEBP) family uncharacterized protein
MRKTWVLLAGVVAIAGCTTAESVPTSKLAPLTVDFAWKPTDKCSTVSPEIHVSDIPQGTNYFYVRLHDRDAPKLTLGGGSVANDGSGILPEGALKNAYLGACPTGSNPHRYYFDVRAIDNTGTAIGRGSSPDRPLP